MLVIGTWPSHRRRLARASTWAPQSRSPGWVWCSRNPIVASQCAVETQGTCSERGRQWTMPAATGSRGRAMRDQPLGWSLSAPASFTVIPETRVADHSTGSTN